MKFYTWTILAGMSAALSAPVLAQNPSLPLDEAVRRALDNHPLVANAQLGVALAEAAVGEAGAGRLPGLLAEASMTRFQEPMIIAPLHAFDILQQPTFDATLIQGRLFAGMTVFDGGMAGARRRAASAGVEAATAGVETARMATIVQVATAYLDALTAIGIDSAHGFKRRALLAERDRVTQLLSEGTIANVDLLQVQAALARTDAERAATVAALDGAIRRLARLTGLELTDLNPRSLTRLDLRNFDRQNDAPAATGHPEVDRALAQLKAAQYGLGAARSSRFPSLQLRGGYVSYAALNGDFTAEWQAGLQVSFPIFTGGARTAAIQKAEAQSEMAAQLVELALWQTAEAEDAARVMVSESMARRDALTAAVTHLTEVVRIMRVALAEGVGVQSDYLQAEAQLAAARADLARATYAVIRSRIAEAHARGELTLEWLTANLEIVR